METHYRIDLFLNRKKTYETHLYGVTLEIAHEHATGMCFGCYACGKKRPSAKVYLLNEDGTENKIVSSFNG